MEVTMWRDVDGGVRLTAHFSARDMIRVNLTSFDRAMLAAPPTSAADALFDAELIARRICEQETAAAKETP